jgi:hypothetical protein
MSQATSYVEFWGLFFSLFVNVGLETISQMNGSMEAIECLSELLVSYLLQFSHAIGKLPHVRLEPVVSQRSSQPVLASLSELETSSSQPPRLLIAPKTISAFLSISLDLCHGMPRSMASE